MTEHEDREAHEAKADDVDRQLDEMEERAGRLEGEIEDAGEDWERKKQDESVPGATGEPAGDEDGGEDGGGEADAEELDFGRSLAEGSGGDDDG